MQMTCESPSPTPEGTLRYNVFTGLIAGFAMFLVGLWVDHKIGARLDWTAAIDENDASVLIGYVLGTAGFLAGLGFLEYPMKRMLGHRASVAVKDPAGAWRYLRVSTDHKVI